MRALARGRRGLPRWLAALLASLAAIAVQALDIPDPQQVQQQTAELQGLLGELQFARATLETEIVQLAAQLAREEASPLDRRIDAEALRAARLDLDSVRARISVMAGQIDQFQLRLRREQLLLAEIVSHLANTGAGSPETRRAQAAIEPLRAHARTTAAMLDTYRHRLILAQRLERLLEQRLALLQSRLRLDTMDELAAFVRDPRVPAIQASITEFLREASRLRSAMAAVAGDTPADQAQRSQLGFEADDAVSHAFLAQNALERILAEHWLDTLATVRDDDLMPLAVLNDGADKLAEIGANLDKIAAALDGQRRALDSQRALFARQDPGDRTRLDLIAALDGQVSEQQRELESLRARLTAERQSYARIIGKRSAASLLEHRPLPATAAEWARVGANARGLPELAWESLRERWAMLVENARDAPPGQWIWIALGSLVVILGTLGGRRLLVRAAVDRPRPMRAALGRALPGLIPAGLVGLVGSVFGVPTDPLVAILLLLLLRPAQVFAMDLARRALAHRGEDAEVQRFLRLLRLGLLPALLVAAVYLLTCALPVAPILGELLDRLAMLGLLTLALPAFAARRLLMHPGERSRRRAAFLGRLSQVLPIFLILTGSLGLAGFANLAWAMLTDFGWALAVATGLSLALGLLSDLERVLDARLRARGGELESLWRTHFLEPGYRAGQLAIAISAGWTLFRLWGWNAETPAVRWLSAMLDTQLLDIGQARLAPADILAVLLLVGAALWIGGWTHQISYQLAYRRVRDLGLRRALSTFTQYLVIVAGVLLSLKIIGFDLTALTVFAASLGVGIGFGMQNIVNNFFSGLLLLGERPLRVGDYVSIGEYHGYVAQIGIRSLSIRTENRQEVFIPNASVIDEKFINWTRSDSLIRQVHVVGIGYDDDRELAMRVIAEILDAEPQVAKLPAPAVYLWDYADSSVLLRFQYYIDIRDGMCRVRVRSAILLEIGRRFAACGIAFPYPHRDLKLTLDPADRQALAGRD